MTNPEGSKPNETLVDLSRLGDLLRIEARKPGVLLPILDGFEVLMAADILGLEAAVADEDIDSCRALAHRMSGSASQLGGMELAIRFDSIQHSARLPRAAAVVEIRELFVRTVAELRRLAGNAG